MKTVLQLSGALALGALAYLCLTLASAVRLQQKHLAAIEMNIADTLHKADLELSELHRLTLEAGLTAMEARKASIKELAFLDQLNAQVSETSLQAQRTLLAVQRSADQATRSEAQLTASATASIDALQPTLAASAQELEDLQQVTRHLDTIVVDPAIPATLASVSQTSAHVAETTADVQQAVHSYLHPTVVQRILGWIKTGVVTAGQVIF